jgi:hypothetical protein
MNSKVLTRSSAPQRWPESRLRSATRPLQSATNSSPSSQNDSDDGHEIHRRRWLNSRLPSATRPLRTPIDYSPLAQNGTGNAHITPGIGGNSQLSCAVQNPYSPTISSLLCQSSTTVEVSVGDTSKDAEPCNAEESPTDNRTSGSGQLDSREIPSCSRPQSSRFSDRVAELSDTGVV